jgi:hypothetical protein
MSFDTPVLMLIYNRPSITKRVFEVLRELKPSRLFIAGDGPNNEVDHDSEECFLTREIFQDIFWDCDTTFLFREKHLGCKTAVSSSIDWFFKNVDEGIVLEDDCLPSLTFFRFCQELLERFRNDSRIMQICGANLLGTWERNDSSYYFSNYGPVWGWASWGRAWRYYDVDMKLWPKFEELNFIYDFCLSKREAAFRTKVYADTFHNCIDTWDYQWGFAKLINSGLSIIPNKNLITNIGFNSNATHTKSSDHPFARVNNHDMVFPLRHPLGVYRDKLADNEYMHKILSKNYFRRAVNSTRQIISDIFP